MDEASAARAVIEEYVAACKARSVDRLKAIFHPDARMSGWLMNQCLVGSPQPFYDALQGAPADAIGSGYRAQISHVEVTGQIASITLEEQGFLGLSFTDYFHLVRVDGRWQIVAKTFTTR
jgi:putative lumazine-binding protein